MDIVTVNEKIFPDKHFRKYLLEQKWCKGGWIFEEDIAKIKRINVNNMGISSLRGIGIFDALEELRCENNNLLSLNLSQNIELTDLNCRRNRLEAIDISKNVKLKNFDCKYNCLYSINSIKGLENTKIDKDEFDIGTQIRFSIYTPPISSKQMRSREKEEDEEQKWRKTMTIESLRIFEKG